MAKIGQKGGQCAKVYTCRGKEKLVIECVVGIHGHSAQELMVK